MHRAADYSVEAKKFRNTVQYTLHWSPYYRMDKFVINNHIPSEGGIYQLFIKKQHHLEELITDRAYYGGLRGTLREMVDPLSPRVFPFKETLEKEPCFCRYVICHSRTIQDEVMAYISGEGKDNIEISEKDHLGLILQM